MMDDNIKDLAAARRDRANAKGEFVEDFAFIAFCIADTARNLAAYSYVASDNSNPGSLTLSKRQLTQMIGQDVRHLTQLIRDLQQKAAEEKPDLGEAS